MFLKENPDRKKNACLVVIKCHTKLQVCLITYDLLLPLGIKELIIKYLSSTRTLLK